MMKILVEHNVSNDEMTCTECDGGGWKVSCSYLRYRDKSGKRGAPIQSNLPKCTLFNQWLDINVFDVVKCDKCRQARRISNEE